MANAQVNCNLELKGEFSKAVGLDENTYGASRGEKKVILEPIPVRG